jgi:regulator of replication initiation timing
MSSSNGPKSPNNEAEEREELESIIKDLEEENATLQAEYDRLKNKQTPTSTPDDPEKTPTQGSGGGQVRMKEEVEICLILTRGICRT